MTEIIAYCTANSTANRPNLTGRMSFFRTGFRLWRSNLSIVPTQGMNIHYILVGDQLDAHFFYIIRLFQSSTCSEQTRAHHQEVNCINTASGIFTLCKWPSGMQVEQFLLDLHTGRSVTENEYTRCCINTIDLLMMSTCFLETCRGLKWTHYMKRIVRQVGHLPVDIFVRWLIGWSKTIEDARYIH